MIKIGIIGYGYWGPNVVRNFTAIKGATVAAVCDQNPAALEKVRQIYSTLPVFEDPTRILKDPHINAVAIVTPVSTHFDLAKRALENGKHIFVEKPFTRTVKEAEELIALAEKKNLTIMVDHTFLFTGAVQKIKALIDEGALGDLNYYDSTRVSLGLFQHDVNVIWDLAPHDFSIIDYILPHRPLSLTAQGVDHTGGGQENIAYITVNYENNLIVHINVNWLSPVKVRTTIIGGQKKMLMWDDLQPDEKIKIYDRGVTVENKEGVYQLLVDYRSGDMWAPRIDRTEALAKETEYFVRCLETGETPVNDGRAGLRVVRMLELADRSLKNGGAVVTL